MVDRPIPFSAPMVRALLAGRKTQTRRLIKFAGIENVMDFVKVATNKEGRPVYEMKNAQGQFLTRPAGKHLLDYHYVTPYGVGDRLWVKETWRTESRAYDDLAPSEMGGEETILYDADADWKLNRSVGKSRVSIHMTRWASRITLMVTDVRVERVQDISEDDAVAEGADISAGHRSQITDGPMVKVGPGTYMSPIAWYHRLWNDINGPGSWEANPWIVACTFSVQHGNIDQIWRAA